MPNLRPRRIRYRRRYFPTGRWALAFPSTHCQQLEDDDGWVALGGVGQRLAVLSSDFDPRTYGYAKLGDLVEKTGSFEIDRSRGRGVYIRMKKAARRQPRQA